jgi:hypothetical protein
LPNVPFVAHVGGGILLRGLGLGDFFFAGILAIQTSKKFGTKTAVTTAVAMAVSFGIWEAFLQDIINGLTPILGRNIGGWPATVCMITGWAPVIAWKMLSERRKKPIQPPVAEPSPSTLPISDQPNITG